MSRRGSILQYSMSDRSASRSNITPSTVNKNASASHQPEPNQLHDYYTHRVESTFPHQEDHVRLNAHEGFGFQNLLATQGVLRDDTNMYREFNVHQGYAGVGGGGDEHAISNEVDEDGSDGREFYDSREGSNMRCSEDPDCLHSFHSSNSSQNSICIKRKSFDTAIDPLSGKKELSLYGTSEFNKASCGCEIGTILRTNFKGPWHSWDKVDAMCKDELFKEFKQEQAGGKELPWDEVFSVLHQKANETGTFVDNRSKTVVENYRNEMIARYGPDKDSHPSFDGAAWCEASGGVSKGRVYGAPRMPKSKVNVSSTSHTYSVHSSYPSTSTKGYQEQLQAKDDIINEMRTEISSIKDCLKILVGNMGQGMPTPMAPLMPSPMAPSMPSPMAPSMPSHTMAPMGPVSSPVYRPRPQLPYNGPSSSHPQHRRSFPP